MNEEIVKLLKKVLVTLSKKFPLSLNLRNLASRDFNLISHREAYDILRYLLNACGQVLELNEKSFSEVRWKSSDPDVKRRLEKCKRYIIDSIKALSKENKVSIPKLKMSDLPVPYSAIYFNTCRALAHYALSYQLGIRGFYFWPRNEASLNILFTNLNYKDQGNHNFEIQQSNLSNEIEILEDKISKLKEHKSKINLLLDNVISKCKYSCALQEESERPRILTSWRDETEKLHKSNSEKIKMLEDLNKILSVLTGLLVIKHKITISGDELRKNIHLEVENLAEMNGFSLFKENHLDISALFKTVDLSIPKATKNREMLKEILSLKLPVIDTGLLSKLENQKKILEERCENIKKHFGEEEINGASLWLKNFLFHIPKVEFTAVNTKFSMRDPVFDEEKLLRFVEPSKKSSQCKIIKNEVAVKKGYVFHRFRDDFSIKYSKNKDKIVPTKRDSKSHLGRRITKRKSISMINMSTISTNSIKSAISDKVDSPCGSESSQKLCSTPKENQNRSSFRCDRNISPISILSGKDKSFLSQERVPEVCVHNDSTLSEGDVHASLLNSYLSTDLDCKSEHHKQDTFDFTNSTADVSLPLDSSPSGISINLSTSIVNVNK